MLLDNWCEYVSEDGEIRNVLQVFCECEDLDETFTNLVSSAARTERAEAARQETAWDRIVATAQDRSRVPWPGGAVKVDLGWLVAATLLWVLRWTARQSTTLSGILVTLAICFGGLGYSHVRALRRRSSSQFHVAWLSFSILWSYSRYLTDVNHTMPWTTNAFAHCALAAMVACYLHCCRADPGRDRVLDGTTLNPDERGGRSRVLRTGKCSICRCTYRVRDHHCVWVGQCVAERNRRTFFAFLVFLAGLSIWFAVKIVILQAGGEPRCSGQLSDQRWLLGLLCLARHNVGGEILFHALYTLTAGIPAAVLAIQQSLLIGAGMTTLEFRRRGKDPYGDKGVDSERSPHPQRSPQIRIFPAARAFIQNWAIFLAGPDLPKLAE